MKLKERLARDRERLRTMNREQARLFIWDYYKLPIIAVVSVLIILLVSVLAGVGHADTALYVVMINADHEGDREVFTRLLESGGVDMYEKSVDVEANYTLGVGGNESNDGDTLQVLAALFGIGDLDVFVANEKVFGSYASQGAFVDLSIFIEPEILAANEADLLRYENGDGVEIVGGVRLGGDSPLHEAGFYVGDVYIGATAQAENLDNAVTLILQLLLESTRE